MTCRRLIQALFELVIFSPEGVQVGDRYADSTLVGLSEHIHLLLVLPAVSSDVTRTRLEELYIVVPYLAGIAVLADVVEDELVGLVHDLTGLARRVVEAVSAADVIEIGCPELDVGDR